MYSNPWRLWNYWFGIKTSSHLKSAQPLQVEHHCTFVVDMNSLASAKDIKCDDMGVWVNSGCHKFPFKVKNEDSGVSVLLSSVKDRDSVFLKREYFKLKHDSHDDVRKRIDIIIRKFDLIRTCLDKKVRRFTSRKKIR